MQADHDRLQRTVSGKCQQRFAEHAHQLSPPLCRPLCPALQKLFDSSRFNYDSDEEEEEEAQQTGSAADAASSAAAPEQEQAVEIVLPPPRGVRVKTAEFIKSSVNVEQCPPPRFPEFAGGGRRWAGAEQQGVRGCCRAV